MVTIYLHGMLGRKFGKVWKLHVKSAAEAFHAIDVNLKGGFRNYFIENPSKEYRIKIGKTFIEDECEVTGPCGSQDVHILPVIKGRNSGVGKILAAVAIVALVFATGGLAQGGWALAKGGLSFWGSIAASTSAALFLGGVSQLLAPKVGYDNVSSTDNGDRKTSTSFAGNASTILQGNPVPVAYGRVLISPLPISVSLVYDDYTAGGIVPDGSTVTVDQSEFVSPDVPPNNPVGQNVTVGTNNNNYLGRYGDIPTTEPLTPSVIPEP